MASRVLMPPGMEGINMGDGTRYHDRPGGAVTVSDEHAVAIDAMNGNGDAGLITGKFRGFLGTRRGRRCEPCNRTWQAWTETCHRCGSPTALV